MTPEAKELYIMDWWLLFGSSADADVFARGVSEQVGEDEHSAMSTFP